MNARLIVAIAVLMLVLVGGGWIVFVVLGGSNSTRTPAENEGSPGLPINTIVAGNGNAAASVSAQSGGQVQAMNGTGDFTKGAGVASSTDPVLFYVTYPPDASTSDAIEYEIDYAPSDKSFVIGIFKEPIGDVRRRAATDLMSRIGIFGKEACSLPVEVLVPVWVNDRYSHMNLGLPGCPGAVQFAGDPAS